MVQFMRDWLDSTVPYRGGGPLEPFEFTLYVDERSPEGRAAIEVVERLLQRHLDASTLDVVDVREETERVEGADVLATPALRKEAPPPTTQIVGDLTDERALLRQLDIPTDETPDAAPE